MAHYGTAAAVKTRTGVGPDDLGLDDDAALTAFLDELLDEATDLMNRRMRKDWTTGSVPKGLDGIANDVVADSVKAMVQTRQTPVVRVDDFAVSTVASRIFTPDVEKRLRLYASSGLSTLSVTPGDLTGITLAVTANQLDTMDN